MANISPRTAGLSSSCSDVWRAQGRRAQRGQEGRDICRARLGRSARLEPASGSCVRPGGRQPFLLDFSALARFFIATGLFLLAEQQVEFGLQGKLGQFVRAPILAPESFEPAASAVVKALKLRDSGIAEIACLAISIASTLLWLVHLLGAEESGWAVQVGDVATYVTLAGWWSVICSVPLFNFLLYRGLWRYLVWAMLLWRIASLKLRLVATHPDGKAGLGFIAEYPNAYSTFRLRNELGDGDRRRAARFRQEHLLGHLRLHPRGLARDRVRAVCVSAAGVHEAAVGTEGKIGPDSWRSGDAIPSRGGAGSDRAECPSRTTQRRRTRTMRFPTLRRSSRCRASYRSSS